MTTEQQTNVAEDPWSEPNFNEIAKLWELSPQDQQKLRILQAKLKDIDHSWKCPDVLLGFAFAGGWENTEERFRKMIQWRLDNNVDSLLKEYKPNRLMLDNSPIAFLKDYDSDGDPVYLERGGACDTKGLLNRFSVDEIMRHAIWLREVQCDGEWLHEYKRRQGRGVRNITVVYDLEGLSASHVHPSVLSLFQQMMQMTDDYYPGPIKRMIIIRAPTMFRFAWQTIKHFFSQESRDQMIFAGSDHLAELSKWMDVSILPPCINPVNGRGETAVGMPKVMDCGIIPDHIGAGGAGYNPPGSGISEPSPCTDKALANNETSSLCSTTDEYSSASDSEGETDLVAATGALQIA